MAFPVDYQTTIDDVTIKCSKPFNELGSITVNDLLPYAISGIHDIGVGRASLSCETFSNYTDIENNTPVEYINSSWSDVRVKYHTEYNPFRANPHYGFTILAYGTDWQNIDSNTTNTRLVLDIPIQKIYVEMPTYTKNTINKVNDGDASTIDSIDWYSTNDVGTIKTISNDTVITNLQILTVFVLSDSNFIIMNSTGQKGAPFIHTTYAWHGNTGNASGGTSGTTQFLPYYSTTYLGNTARYVNMANDDALENNTFGNVDWSRHFIILFDTPNNEHEQTNSYVVVTYTGAGPPDFNGTVTFYPKGGERAAMLGFANSCLKFKYGLTMYKPLISGGAVYDYTDDMDAESEFDNITTVTGNNVPLTPPSPPLDPFDVDPETYGWSGGEVSGMVKYYLLTAGQMSSLQTAIASNANWTIDYLNCIVSCFVVPNGGIFFDAPIPTTVKFKLDNATEWDTGVGCSRIQGTKNKSGGTIEIPRLTNTFYDFEPYSDYSVYIPFCGRVPIKGNVCLGHEIKVTYYPDVPTCSLTAVVSCGGATIAIAKGSFGTMTPVTSNGSDRKTAAVIGDVAPIITGIGTGIVGVALGNPLIVGAGAAQALGGIMGGVKETVQSYAYSVGSTGDSSFFSAGNRCFYYANYPLIDEVVNNSMFGHSVGYLCNRVGKLSGFTGFTICANPHVTFSASAEEREEIERLLSMGVIL